MTDQIKDPSRYSLPFVRILGTPVSIVSLGGVLRLFEAWASERCDRSVVLRDVHGVMAEALPFD